MLSEFPLHIEILLIVSAFLTSMLSAILGMGGGISLLTIMMFFFPVKTLIPAHGLIQLTSNGFRVYLNRKHLVWSVFLPLMVGGVLGSVLGSQVFLRLPQELYRPLIAIFILYVTWMPKSKKATIKFKAKFYLVGFVSHFLSLVFGATGPFLAPFLLGEGFNRYQIIATKAAAQFTGHLFKMLAFFIVGVSLTKYINILVVMIVAVFLGTYLGKRVLDKVPEKIFLILFKALITALCLVLIIKTYL